MTTSADIARAEARAIAARQRLIGTFEEVQHRLTAAALAHDAVEIASEGAVKVARNAAEAARARPMTVAAVVGTIGLLAARGPIARLFKRNNSQETGATERRSKSRPARGQKGN